MISRLEAPKGVCKSKRVNKREGKRETNGKNPRIIREPPKSEYKSDKYDFWREFSR